jgi:hypothetical protein
MFHPFQTCLAPFDPTGDYQDWQGGLAGLYRPLSMNGTKNNAKR